jgi:heme/copper-type cytochrome/quinol oxidase subunit 2
MDSKEDLTTSGKSVEASPGKTRHGGAFFIAIVVLIVAIFTGLIAFGVQTIIGGNEKPAEGTVIDGVRVFNISVKEWVYEPSVIRVNPGEAVRFVVTSKDVWHGFAINELDINLTVPSEKTVTKEVTIPSNAADKVYTMYCSVFCGLGHPYLKGKVIIGNPKMFLGVGVGKTLPYVATLAMAGIFAAVIIIARRKTGRLK